MATAVRPITDRAKIDAILRDPWIAAKIAVDGQNAGYIDHPNLSYFGAYVDGDLVGVFMRVRFTATETEVHAALLKRALPHSRELGRLFIDEIFNDPRILRITAHIIGSLGSAINYCRKLGFSIEGERRSACVKNGEVLSVVTLGLLRSESRTA